MFDAKTMIDDLLQRNDLRDKDVELLTDFQIAMERGETLSVNQIAVLGRIHERKARVDEYRSKTFQVDAAVPASEPQQRDEWGFTEAHRANIFAQSKDSRHGPTQQAIFGKNDAQIWDMWLRGNGYRSTTPIDWTDKQGTIHTVYEDRGRRETSHTPQSVKDDIVAHSRKRKRGQETQS